MYNYRARVIRVVDGDTVDLNVDVGFHATLKIRGRLLYVDTPERGHKDFKFATSECVRYLEMNMDDDGYVKISTEKTGSFGRWLVSIEGVNSELAAVWPAKKKYEQLKKRS